jgi:hypothetical protein
MNAVLTVWPAADRRCRGFGDKNRRRANEEPKKEAIQKMKDARTTY